MKPLVDSMARLSRKYFIIGGLIVVIIIAAGSFYVLHQKHPALRSGRAMGQQVSIASVASLSPNNAPLSVIGTLASEDQATILSQASGEIVYLDKQLGDQVSAGDVIASLDDSSQKATLLQAQGAYNVAQANYEKLLAGATTQSIQTSQDSVSSAKQNLSNIYGGALNTLNNAYTAMYNAYNVTVTIQNNYFTTQDPQGIAVSTAKNDISANMQSTQTSLSVAQKSMAPADIDATIIQTLSSLNNVYNDLDTIRSQCDQGIYFYKVTAADKSSLDSQKVSVNNALTGSTALTGVISLQQNIASLKLTLQTAQDQLGVTTAPPTQADTDLAKAQMLSAQGQVDAAQAIVNNSIIRSPISGTIVDLPITKGDYISSSNEVAKVSNPSALKIDAYITAQDAKTIAVGNKATINSNISGVITNIPSAIDPATGAIEVEIGLPGNTSGLTDGDSVTVDLDRTAISSSPNDSASNNASIIIPIVALKITPTGPVIFTINKNKKALVSHSVQIGSILGENIVITSGLTDDMVIVTDARGLTNGEKVSVKKS